MKFNEVWTKDRNDQLRQMIREKKSVEDIISFFGKDVLSHHPKKKYTYDGSPLSFMIGCDINKDILENGWKKIN